MTRDVFSRYAFVGFILFLLSAVAVACDREPECSDLQAWSGFTRFLLSQYDTDTDTAIEWRTTYDKEAVDAVIESVVHEGGDSSTGTVALVGGRFMLSKGRSLERGYEIDALDAPVLSINLLLSVLDRAFPSGPDSISGKMPFDHSGASGIRLATQSASGYIAAPWQAKGEVSRADGGDLGFEVILSFPSEGAGYKSGIHSITMRGSLGVWEGSVLLDTDSLEGWVIHEVGPMVIERPGATIYDYGAQPLEEPGYRTVGDLRAAIAADNDPGHRDETLDFTGFWKTDCDNAFGLQIMRQGDEGKYSVVFCGPGGCGDPAAERLTYITGDKGYEVVSQAELVVVPRSGKRQTYRRCTKNTHPVLEYRK